MGHSLTTRPPTRLTAAALLLVATALSGCAAASKKPIGSSCGLSDECESGLCFGQVCLDPAGDNDGDSLTNSLEATVGSNAGARDTDGDLILDPDELGPGLALVDTDGDGKPDIIESILLDADKDCITDQLDADDAAPSADKSPMVDVVCPSAGICGQQHDRLRVTCPDGLTAQCVFDDVVGYADPEPLCDGVDENCDGTADESFPGGCVAPRTPFVAAGSGGKTLSTARYRATLVMGQPALAAPTTSRYRALVGGNPGIAPQAPSIPETP